MDEKIDEATPHLDLHRSKAAEMFGVAYDEVTPEQRAVGKMQNYYSIYSVKTQSEFLFNVGTYPTLVMRSRNHREGRYSGKFSGAHLRVSLEFCNKYVSLMIPTSSQIRPLNRKQRKLVKMSEGEM